MKIIQKAFNFVYYKHKVNKDIQVATYLGRVPTRVATSIRTNKLYPILYACNSNTFGVRINNRIHSVYTSFFHNWQVKRSFSHYGISNYVGKILCNNCGELLKVSTPEDVIIGHSNCTCCGDSYGLLTIKYDRISLMGEDERRRLISLQLSGFNTI